MLSLMVFHAFFAIACSISLGMSIRYGSGVGILIFTLGFIVNLIMAQAEYWIWEEKQNKKEGGSE